MPRVLPRATAALLVALTLSVPAWTHAAEAAPALDVQGWAETQGTPVPGGALTADNGTWAGAQPTDYDYQWLRDGVAIDGATTRVYLVTPDDVGHALAPRVTGHAGTESDTFVGTGLTARKLRTTVTLDARHARLPGKQRKVWFAEVELRLERPWATDGTVSVTKPKDGRQKLLATGVVTRGMAVLRLPWKHAAPLGRTKLTACYTGSAALESSCSPVEVVRR